VFGQNVNVGNNVVIGDFCKIQNNVSIYEGVILEDYVFCGPSMVFTNVLNPRCKYPQVGSEYYHETQVGEGASLGANCTIVCGNRIGKHSFVGAGAVVTKDVPSYALVVGSPAKIIGWVSEAGERLLFNSIGEAECVVTGLKYIMRDNIVTAIL
jgi:UDP-2-acetamido-3-amino-2,3-dideoxy-glucuronate N-acetyltransferase